MVLVASVSLEVQPVLSEDPRRDGVPSYSHGLSLASASTFPETCIPVRDVGIAFYVSASSPYLTWSSPRRTRWTIHITSRLVLPLHSVNISPVPVHSDAVADAQGAPEFFSQSISPTCIHLRDRRKRRSCDLIHELLLQEPEQSCMARIAIRTGCTHTASLAGARRKGLSLRGASKQWTEVYLNQAPTTRLGFQFSVSRTLRPYSLNFADLAAPPQTAIPQYSSTGAVSCARALAVYAVMSSQSAQPCIVCDQRSITRRPQGNPRRFYAAQLRPQPSTELT